MQIEDGSAERSGGSGSTDNSESTTATAPTSDYNPWRYASGYYDQVTGHLKFGTRYYMPPVATWTQADPVNGEPTEPLRLNAYTYAGSNPVVRTDTSGRYFGEDVVNAVAGWDGWDEAYELYGLAGSCFAGGVLVGSYGTAIGTVVFPGIGSGAGSVIGFFAGCAAGMISAEVAGSTILESP